MGRDRKFLQEIMEICRAGNNEDINRDQAPTFRSSPLAIRLANKEQQLAIAIDGKTIENDFEAIEKREKLFNSIVGSDSFPMHRKTR